MNPRQHAQQRYQGGGVPNAYDIAFAPTNALQDQQTRQNDQLMQLMKLQEAMAAPQLNLDTINRGEQRYQQQRGDQLDQFAAGQANQQIDNQRADLGMQIQQDQFAQSNQQQQAHQAEMYRQWAAQQAQQDAAFQEQRGQHEWERNRATMTDQRALQQDQEQGRYRELQGVLGAVRGVGDAAAMGLPPELQNFIVQYMNSLPQMQQLPMPQIQPARPGGLTGQAPLDPRLEELAAKLRLQLQPAQQ